MPPAKLICNGGCCGRRRNGVSRNHKGFHHRLGPLLRQHQRRQCTAAQSHPQNTAAIDLHEFSPQYATSRRCSPRPFYSPDRHPASEVPAGFSAGRYPRPHEWVGGAWRRGRRRAGRRKPALGSMQRRPGLIQAIECDQAVAAKPLRRRQPRGRLPDSETGPGFAGALAPRALTAGSAEASPAAFLSSLRRSPTPRRSHLGPPKGSGLKLGGAEAANSSDAGVGHLVVHIQVPSPRYVPNARHRRNAPVPPVAPLNGQRTATGAVRSHATGLRDRNHGRKGG